MNTQQGWIGVDLDGTLATYDGWKGRTHIGDPVPIMLRRVRKWIAGGKDVRIFTARVKAVVHPDDVEDSLVRNAIDLWCEQHLGLRLPITCVKDYAMIELWDDRAVQVIPNTGLPVDPSKQ